MGHGGAPYGFSIVHRSGAANTNADGLSRGALPVDPGDDARLPFRTPVSHRKGGGL